MQRSSASLRPPMSRRRRPCHALHRSVKVLRGDQDHGFCGAEIVHEEPAGGSGAYPFVGDYPQAVAQPL